jgi:excisionase family DNA binding protein
MNWIKRAMSKPNSEFLTMQEATRLLGMGRMTLWRRVRDGVLPVYRSERDRRVRLVKRADVERLLTPTIEPPAGQSKGDRSDE